MTKISYTSIEKYITCPKKYDLHYNHKYRSISIGSPLIFGSAIDHAITHLITTKNLQESKDVFDKSFSFTRDNFGNVIVTRSSPLIAYRPNDLDMDLLGSTTSTNAPWDSLQRKGHIILESFAKNVLPKIKEVIAIQPAIELKNELGDQVIGKADFIVRWINDEIVCFDLKTSGMMYDKDVVKTSTQLAVYSTLKEKYNIDKCGYWVAIKNIKKNKTKICSKCGMDGTGTSFHTCNRGKGKARCNGEWNVTLNPEAYIQIIIDNVDDLFQQQTIENLNEITHGINNKVFYRNYNSCDMPWGPCEYKKLCHSNSLEGLIKK